jgi:hypothetical protein
MPSLFTALYTPEKIANAHTADKSPANILMKVLDWSVDDCIKGPLDTEWPIMNAQSFLVSAEPSSYGMPGSELMKFRGIPGLWCHSVDAPVRQILHLP